ncbi:unnamed protein product [Arabis nemorensis]|uniref:Uncharacterized protein n=1 Tax=Arabis nemorensis TaxID=586526 RepID=A0A565BX08_9BRAS|nr:unnamed protein product [Arabis nemorensis]
MEFAGTSKADHQEEPLINAPESVLDAHRKLLLTLSNLTYCKDQLPPGLYNKYKYTWLQSRATIG